MLFVVVLFAAFLVSLVAECWWTEFDADRIAIQLETKRDFSIEVEVPARTSEDEMIGALRTIYGEANLKRSSWMNPSCEQQITAIRRRAGGSVLSPVEIAGADV